MFPVIIFDYKIFSFYCRILGWSATRSHDWSTICEKDVNKMRTISGEMAKGNDRKDRKYRLVTIEKKNWWTTDKVTTGFHRYLRQKKNENAYVPYPDEKRGINWKYASLTHSSQVPFGFANFIGFKYSLIFIQAS